MAIEEDFCLAWDSFADRIVSWLAKSSLEDKAVSYEDFHQYYHQEIRMWNDVSKIQYNFLKRYEEKTPGFRDKFLEILENFRVKRPEKEKFPSLLPYISGSAAVMAAGGMTGWFLPQDSFMKAHFGNTFTFLAAIILFGMVGGGVLKAFYDAAVEKYCKRYLEHYHAQLKKLHDQLLTFCREYENGSEIL